MSRPSMKTWAARLTPEEVDQIVKQVLRDFKADENRTELKNMLQKKRRPNRTEEP